MQWGSLNLVAKFGLLALGPQVVTQVTPGLVLWVTPGSAQGTAWR